MRRDLGRVELPLVGDVLEPVRAAVGEAEAGAGDQVLHGARGQILPGAGAGRHAGGEVHRDALDAVLAELDLAGGQADADAQPVLGELGVRRRGGADGAGRAVERGEEAVAVESTMSVTPP